MNARIRTLATLVCIAVMAGQASATNVYVNPGIPLENSQDECLTDTSNCCEKTAKTGGAPWRDPVNCGFQCPLGSLLTIAAHSHDTKWGIPDVWGQVNCEEHNPNQPDPRQMGAECLRGPGACAGQTTEPILFWGSGSCTADTDDFWASRTTVTCIATVPEIWHCGFDEAIPSAEEIRECGYDLTCDTSLVGSTGHETGVSYCRVEDDDGSKSHEEVCVHAMGVKIYCEDITTFDGADSLGDNQPPSVSDDALVDLAKQLAHVRPTVHGITAVISTVPGAATGLLCFDGNCVGTPPSCDESACRIE